MKRCVMLLALALMAGCAHVDPVDSCVLVRCVDGHGSGCVIDDHLVLTAAHVAEDAVSVRLQNGTELPVLFAFFDPNEDAAVLFVLGDLPAPLPVSLERLNRGDEIVAIGAPWNSGMQGNMLFGRVVNLNIGMTYDPNDPNDNCFNDLLDVNMGPGISGGPVLRNGKVVGIMVGLTCGYGAMLPTASFKELLER